MDTRSRHSPRTQAAAAAFGAALALAGCGGHGPGGKTTPTPTHTATPSASAGGGRVQGTAVTATENEWSIHLSRTSFTPGRYTFTAQNAGRTTHSLAISGPGLPETQTHPLTPGSTAQLTVTLRAGSYELWCPIDEHKGLGMDTHIEVRK